jgi:hypothetical protein
LPVWVYEPWKPPGHRVSVYDIRAGGSIPDRVVACVVTVALVAPSRQPDDDLLRVGGEFGVES